MEEHLKKTIEELQKTILAADERSEIFANKEREETINELKEILKKLAVIYSKL